MSNSPPYQVLAVTASDRSKYEALGLAKWPPAGLNARQVGIAEAARNRAAYAKKLALKAAEGRDNPIFI